MAEFIENYTWAFWIGEAIVTLIVEVSTSSLVSIWFVPSAVISAVLSVFFHNFGVECVVFFILSGLFLVIFRNVYKRYIKEKNETEEKGLIVGKTGKLTADTDENGGNVLIGDIYWKAKTEGGEIPKGSIVEVKAENGTTLIVEPIEEKTTV